MKTFIVTVDNAAYDGVRDLLELADGVVVYKETSAKAPAEDDHLSPKALRDRMETINRGLHERIDVGSQQRSNLHQRVVAVEQELDRMKHTDARRSGNLRERVVDLERGLGSQATMIDRLQRRLERLEDLRRKSPPTARCITSVTERWRAFWMRL